MPSWRDVMNYLYDFYAMHPEQSTLGGEDVVKAVDLYMKLCNNAEQPLGYGQPLMITPYAMVKWWASTGGAGSRIVVRPTRDTYTDLVIVNERHLSFRNIAVKPDEWSPLNL